MQHLSFWEKDSFFDHIDVLIVGSGIVGLNAAISLKEKAPQLRVTVVERGPLPSGASTRNAGFACFGSLTELIDDLKQHSEEEMLALVERRWKGLERLRSRVGDKAMSFKKCGGYEVFTEDDFLNYEACLEQMDYFNQLLAPIIGKERVFSQADQDIKTQDIKGIEHLLFNSEEGQLHAGQMMKTLAKKAVDLDIQLLHGIQIVRFDEKTKGVNVQTVQGWRFKASRVLVCTNGFAKQLFPSLDVIPARNQVLITAPIPNLKLNGTFHYNKGYVYFRNVDNRILLGGGRHLALREEQTDNFGLTDTIQEFLEGFLYKHLLPNTGAVEIEQRWSGILGLGEQKKPIISQYSDHIFTAVRLGGMGVAIGSLVGEEGADLVLEHM